MEIHNILDKKMIDIINKSPYGNNKTEEDIYSDQQTTLTEAIAVVKGKLAAGIPITGAKEEVAEDFIKDWSDLFGAETAK